MKPYVIEKIRHSDGSETVFEPQPVRRVLKESTSASVTRMLVHGVTDGAAKNGAVEGYSIAGKTGTSQIAFRGQYEEGV